jgi:hypothetical protein
MFWRHCSINTVVVAPLFLLSFLWVTACDKSNAPGTHEVITGLVDEIPVDQDSLARPENKYSPSLQFSQGQIKFEQLTTEQGLSQNTVFCVLQDSRGFMWFGTEDGLNKYDGYGFQVFRHDPEDPTSINGNYIQSIYEDHMGFLLGRNPFRTQ